MTGSDFSGSGEEDEDGDVVVLHGTQPGQRQIPKGAEERKR